MCHVLTHFLNGCWKHTHAFSFRYYAHLTIHNSRDVEATLMSTGSWRDKGDVRQVCRGVSVGRKESEISPLQRRGGPGPSCQVEEVRKRKTSTVRHHKWNLKDDASELAHEPEADPQARSTDVCLQRARHACGWLGSLGWAGTDYCIACIQSVACTQTVTYRVDKQQGPTMQRMELHSVSCDKP